MHLSKYKFLDNPFLLYITFLLFSSCAVDSYHVNSVSLTSTPCPSPVKGVYVFFEGEKIDFDYERVSLLEAEGSSVNTTEKGLISFKNAARDHCANVIINLKKGNRISSVSSSNGTNTSSINSVPTMEGLAVRVKIDSAFVAKYGIGDTTDYKSIIQENEDELSARRGCVTGGMVTMLIGVIVLKAVSNEK
jgi:hypothetical protein